MARLQRPPRRGRGRRRSRRSRSLRGRREHLRAVGEWRLDADEARQRGQTSLAQHAGLIDSGAVTLAADASSVTVTTSRHVPFTLLRLLGLDGHDVGLTASAQPGPRR